MKSNELTLTIQTYWEDTIVPYFQEQWKANKVPLILTTIFFSFIGWAVYSLWWAAIVPVLAFILFVTLFLGSIVTIVVIWNTFMWALGKLSGSINIGWWEHVNPRNWDF